MANNTLERISNLVGDFASTYDTDRIIILGKGPSADDVEQHVFDTSLVIALNDAEWICDPDIAIFHEDWVGESIRAAGTRAKLYLTSTNFESTNAMVEHLDYQPLSNDTADLMMSRFIDTSDLVIEEMMMLTALEVARIVAEQRGKKQRVYLVGLDFAPERGYSRRVKVGYDPATQSARESAISMQEHFLRNALYMLRDSNLEVNHVGGLDFSRVSTVGLNSLLGYKADTLTPSRQLEQEVLVTAEVTTNHFGDRGRLERLIRESKAAGADFVKFQKRDVDTFYTPEQLAAPYVSPFGSTFGDYRHALELDHDDFEFIDGICNELGIGWFLSVLDQPSFEYVQELAPAMIKLPSTISEHTEYLTHVAKSYSGPLVLSTGMTDEAYEAWVLETFGDQQTLYLLHCNSAYPTPEEDCNIGVIRRYDRLSERHPNLIPGWSSHDPGWFGSALAVAAGARMVEKHVKLGNTEWAHFDAVALDLTTNAFKEYVDAIRRAQAVVGTTRKRVTASEHHKYRVAN